MSKKDPLRIIGQPNPTPTEREQAETLALASGRPAKMCRAALIQAGGDDAKARTLLDDEEFIRLNTDYDINLIGKLAGDNPMKAMQYFIEQHALHAGGLTADQKKEYKAAGKRVKQYEKRRSKMEAHEKQVKAATGTAMVDPVLGKLRWDTLWEGKADVPPFGKLPFAIETDKGMYDVATPPSAPHRKAFEQFVAAAEKLRPAIEKANFEYFQRVRSNYEDSGMKPPKITSATALWKHLRSIALHIPHQDGKAWRVALSWNCSWDEEHGHAVYIEGGRIVNVSIQGDGYDAP